MAKNDKHAAPPVEDPNVPKVQTIDDAGYVDVNVGFAPYFSPTEGAQFKGRLLDVDDRDPEFIRYTFMAETEMECFTGPSDDAETVIVRPGEPFNVSGYAQIPFEQYGGMSMIVSFKDKVPTKTAGRKVWRMGLKLKQEDYEILQARRRESMETRVARAKSLRGEIEASRALAESRKQSQAQA
jgi:hypothetical protein